MTGEWVGVSEFRFAWWRPLWLVMLLTDSPPSRQRHARDAKGQKQRKEAAGQLSHSLSSAENTFPQWLGTSAPSNLFLKTHNTGSPTGTLLSLYGNPPTDPKADVPFLLWWCIFAVRISHANWQRLSFPLLFEVMCFWMCDQTM